MDLLDFTPKYVTFDCYGTLTNYPMNATVAPLAAELMGEADIAGFTQAFRAYRMDEILGEFKLYPQVIRDSWQRACNRYRVQYRSSDVDALLAAIASWGPHPDVPEALAKLAEHFPLVILSNAVDGVLEGNVARLGTPFHRVFTAEQAGAYKPRYRPFEYMLEQLDCERDEILHVSSHVWYDLIPCHELGITHKVYVNRGYDPSTPFYGYAETPTLTGVPGLLGI